jgi:membrane protease YdiL (CAAX protease family)
MTNAVITAPAPAPAGTARREAVRFVVIQALLGAAGTAVAVTEGVNVSRIEEASPLGQAVTYGLAFTPLIAALVARLTTTRTLRGFGFRRVGWRPLLLAWAIGLVPVLVAYAVVWSTGVGRFVGNPASALLAGTALVAPYVLLALAEDVGWRGLLVTRLAQIARHRTVYLISGVVWSLSHLGLILFVGGAPEGVSPLYAAMMFTIATTALGSILAAMQLRWGLWPGVIAHAAVNAILYHFADPSTAPTGSLTGWIATETGLAYALAMVVTALAFFRWFGTAAKNQPCTSAAVDPS